MITLLLVLLVVLVVVVAVANASRKKGQLSQASYSMLVSGVAICVTITALVLMYLRLRS